MFGGWGMGRVFGLYVIFVSVCILSVSLFVPTSFSSQPPIDLNRFVEGTVGWGPRRADPARAYDTASDQLIFNVYETLIAWKSEIYYDFVPVLATNVPTRVDARITITNTSTVPVDTTGSTWTDGSVIYTSTGYYDFNGSILGFSQGDVIYLSGDGAYRTWYVESMNGSSTITLNLCRGTYIFNIRTSPTISYYNETGDVVDTFDVGDARYSLLRGLVQDQIGSSQWMFYEPFFGTMNSDPFNSNTTGPTAISFANLLNNVIEASGNDLLVNLGIPFPDNAFKQMLSNTFGSIVSEEFSKNIGCWNGDLFTDTNADGFPDWWTSVRRVSRSPYDTSGAYRYVGTGPYYVSVFNQTGNQVVMQRNTLWWQGWPSAYRYMNLTIRNGNAYSPGFVDTYEIDYIADWTLRKSTYLAGLFDVCAVPRVVMFELLNNATREPDLTLDPYMKTIKYLTPVLSMEAMHFCFTINSTSPFTGTGSFPNGIPSTFFNNTNVRKAFAYSFNNTQYMEETYFSEADYRKNMFIKGLYPDYYNASIQGYDANFAGAEAALKAAVVDGQNVWDNGFTFTLVHNLGAGPGRIACELIREFFGKLSTYDGRVGNPFKINIAEIDWATYLKDFETFVLPIFDIGWVADFADADNFARPYMHSDGDFSYYQNYTADNGWGKTKDLLIDQGLVTSDGPARAALYQQLQVIYSNDVPSFPIAVPYGRRWCQSWVKGWYYDPIYPGTYIPSVYKYDDCWFDIAGPAGPVSDGIVNMRDITFLILHFDAKRPFPGLSLDPDWIGTYGGNGGIDAYGNGIGADMRDIQGVILHFSHKNNTLTP
jgi:peptide/nickel transport system substrate-binding protein